MNLKESYRYANYLDSLLRRAYSYLNSNGFVTTTVEEHLRSKSNPDVNDERIEVKSPYDVEFTPNDVINFVVKVLNEKEKLSDAIAKAKSTTEIDIDNAVAMNKKKQQFVGVLNEIADIKPSETKTTGKAYKFDINGEQKPYIYDVNRKTSINFDRNDVRKLVKKYLKETDEISSKLDLIEITTQADIEPRFDVNDKFEELVVAL